MDSGTLLPVLAVIALLLLIVVIVLLVIVLRRVGRHHRAIRDLERSTRELARARDQQAQQAPDKAGADPDRDPQVPARVAVVMNPSMHTDPAAFTERLHRFLDVYGVGAVRVYETTREDPGHGQTLQAIDDGAELVIAAGGDGTVRMVASALADREVRMGIVPVGTGNLLARNLEIPLDDVDGALRIALTGADRRVDVGWLRTGNSREELEAAEPQIFLVISGIGADAEVIGATNPLMKKRIGWIAYVVAGLRKISGHAYDVEVRLDDGPVQAIKARTVLIGNVGRLPAGIVLMPEAAIDNRKLEIMALNWRGAAGLSQILSQLVNPRLNALPRMSMVERRLTTKIAVVAAKPQPVQLDGDMAEDATHLVAEVDPGALLIRAPQRA